MPEIVLNFQIQTLTCQCCNELAVAASNKTGRTHQHWESASAGTDCSSCCKQSDVHQSYRKRNH